jgi:hypothetical protein
MKIDPSDDGSIFMAGEEGFEPPILGPEPSALPLGHSPSSIRQTYGFSYRAGKMEYILSGYLFPLWRLRGYYSLWPPQHKDKYHNLRT